MAGYPTNLYFLVRPEWHDELRITLCSYHQFKGTDIFTSSRSRHYVPFLPNF